MKEADEAEIEEEAEWIYKYAFNSPPVSLQVIAMWFIHRRSKAIPKKILSLPSPDRLTQNATYPKYFMAISEKYFYLRRFSESRSSSGSTPSVRPFVYSYVGLSVHLSATL